MPGAWIRLPDGTAMHIRYPAPRRKRCKFCNGRNFATLECDFPIAPGVTCDAKMCSSCSRPVGEDLDHCPDHAGFKARGEVAIPKTRQGLIDAGYVWVNVGECRGCEARIEWWMTPNTKPDGSKPRIPMSVKSDDTLTPHFAICPARKAFQRAQKKHDERANGKKPEQTKLF